MNKVWLVFKREYLFRVKKKSFIIITLLMPLLFASFVVLPALVMQKSMEKHYKVALIDLSNKLDLQDTKDVDFVRVNAQSIEALLPRLKKDTFDAVLFVNKDFEKQGAVIYLLSDKDIKVSELLSKAYQSAVENYRLTMMNIKPEDLAQIKAPAPVTTLKWSEKGATQSTAGVRLGLAATGAILLYMFMFIYGGMAMRSVMEEKVNRVVELIISSVRPLQLMFGKLLAIMLVAITQFVIWLVLIWVSLKVANNLIGTQSATVTQIQQVLSVLGSVNLGLWIFTFIFFFLTGYLLYGSWFAAIGSAVDVETDAQQFVTPLTLPIIFAIIFMQAIIFNPDGQLAFWLSIIPFTSPIIMPLRISFGIGEAVMWWEYILSLVLMLVTVWASLWASGKVFRMGILFYGKRPTYRDLWKWIKQK